MAVVLHDRIMPIEVVTGCEKCGIHYALCSSQQRLLPLKSGFSEKGSQKLYVSAFSVKLVGQFLVAWQRSTSDLIIYNFSECFL